MSSRRSSNTFVGIKDTNHPSPEKKAKQENQGSHEHQLVKQAKTYNSMDDKITDSRKKTPRHPNEQEQF